MKKLLIILLSFVGFAAHCQELDIVTGPFFDSSNYIAPPPAGIKGIIPVTHFRQCGQSWSGNPYGSGTCSSTICTDGCAMTCGAMLLKTNGANVDPGLLNSWLQNNAGYINCSTVWTAVDDYPGSTMAWYGAAAYSLSIVKAEIDAGNPVIIHVDYSSTCSHFVLIYGYNGSGSSAADFVVADPASSLFPRLLSDFNICTSDPNGSLRLFHNVYGGCVSPAVPVCLAPGTATGPGQMINSLTPTLSWSAVSGATDYDVFIRKNPPSGPLILQEHCLANGTSYTVAAGVLENDSAYRWNVQANTSCTLCESGYATPLYFWVNVPSGNMEFDISENLDIYPNPGNGIFSVELLLPKNMAVKIEMINVLGQIIYESHYSFNAGLNKTIINPGAIEKGVYYLRIKTPDSFVVRKILVE